MRKEEFLLWVRAMGLDLEAEGIRIEKDWTKEEMFGREGTCYTVRKVPKKKSWSIKACTRVQEAQKEWKEWECKDWETRTFNFLARTLKDHHWDDEKYQIRTASQLCQFLMDHNLDEFEIEIQDKRRYDTHLKMLDTRVKITNYGRKIWMI